MITHEVRWESQRLFFPSHVGSALFARSRRPVLYCIRAILWEITWKGLRQSDDREFRPENQAARNRLETIKLARRLRSQIKITLAVDRRYNGIGDKLPLKNSPRTRSDNQESAWKPGPGPKIKKYGSNRMVSHGWIQRHIGAKFFKRGFEKLRRKVA